MRARAARALWGKVGLFASAVAKQERAQALRAADALPASLERIGAAESQAEGTYRASVRGQRLADATGIPRLSAAAETAISTLRAAPDEKTRAEAWRAVQKDEPVAGELATVCALEAQRFGQEKLREVLRNARRGEQAVPATAEQHVTSILSILNSGERAAASEQREAQRLTQRRGF